MMGWLLSAIVASAVCGFGAEGLRLPEFTVGTNTYSNVTITASSRGRVLIEFPLGMAAARIADLDLDQQEQLLNAGLIANPWAKEIARELAKRDAARRKAGRKAARGHSDTPELSLESAQEQSIVRLLAAQANARAEEHAIEPDLEALLGRFGAPMVYGISAALTGLWLLRRYLFFRIYKNATGEGSFLVFLPIIRWFALAGAANMSRHWLLVPLFATAALFMPPAVMNQISWAVIVWLCFVGVLWLATALLYIAWCVRICRAVGCSGWLALLMIPPVVDNLALLILAFAGKADSTPLSVPLKKPVLAV